MNDSDPDPARCTYCGRRCDGPGFDRECQDQHERMPDRAERLADEIESAICGRKGFDWRGLDDEIVDEIRTSLASIVRPWLQEPE